MKIIGIDKADGHCLSRRLFSGTFIHFTLVMKKGSLNTFINRVNLSALGFGAVFLLDILILGLGYSKHLNYLSV